LEKPSRSNILLTAISFSLVAGFHQLSFAFFVLLLAVVILALWFFSRQSLRRNLRPVAASLFLGGIFCLPYLPVYLRLLEMQQGPYPGTSISFEPATDLGVHLLYLPWLAGIVVATALIVVGLFWLRRIDKDRAVILGTVFMFSLILSLFLLPPPFAEMNRRAHFFMYFPVWLIAAVLLSQFWSWQSPRLSPAVRWLPKVLTVGIVIASLCSTTFTSQRALRDGLDYYGYLDDARWEAVQWIGLNTNSEAVTAAYPESLGWWIEADAEITVCGVTARHMAPYDVLTERSLAAERILSRHQGLENGVVRLANGYPYAQVPGNPVLGAYIGGSYQDMLMLDDTRNVLQIDGSGSTTLIDAPKQVHTNTNADSLELVTEYLLSGAGITQTARLDRGSRHATVSWVIQGEAVSGSSFDMPVVSCYEPQSVLLNSSEHSIEIVQEFKTIFEGVVSVTIDIAIEISGATITMSDPEGDSIPLSFHLTGNEAKVDFLFTFTVPDTPGPASLVHYEVPQVIKDHSITYVTVDLKPDAQLWNDLPEATEVWLDNCPYLRLVYSRDNVNVYRVDASVLP